jgi:Na+-transporting NADH:ubiquinone oxidoreductase subunit A
LRVNLGASLEEVSIGRLNEGEARVISGSVLSGRIAAGPFAFLGRFNTQVSVIEEGRVREFLGWQKPGFGKFSVKRTFASSWLPGYLNRKFSFTTDTGGSLRAVVPIGSYERVMPLDMEPTYLLRSLLSKDTDLAQSLGALELDEEDMGLLTFVCPTKEEYAPLLRSVLNTIEREG